LFKANEFVFGERHAGKRKKMVEEGGAQAHRGPDQEDFDLKCFLPYQLNQLAELVSNAFQESYQRDFGLTRTQWRILAHLASADGMTAKEIAGRVHEDKVSISRGVVGLEARSLLRRAPDPKDRRFEFLHLTESGRGAFAEVVKRAHAFEAELTRHVGQGVVEALQANLTEVLSRWETFTVGGKVSD
jgi:DNA-binding MarR family transcriptional regulator